MSAEINGLDDIIKKLQNMAPDLRKKALRHAVGKSASVIRKRATALAPKDTGSMAKNIRVQFASRSSRRTGNIQFRVGVRGGAQEAGAAVRYARSRKAKKDKGFASGSATWYWRLIEFGTKSLPARSFMRKSMNDSSLKVFETIYKNLEAGIQKYAEKGSSE